MVLWLYSNTAISFWGDNCISRKFCITVISQYWYYHGFPKSLLIPTNYALKYTNWVKMMLCYLATMENDYRVAQNSVGGKLWRIWQNECHLPIFYFQITKAATVNLPTFSKTHSRKSDQSAKPDSVWMRLLAGTIKWNYSDILVSFPKLFTFYVAHNLPKMLSGISWIFMLPLFL